MHFVQFCTFNFPALLSIVKEYCSNVDRPELRLFTEVNQHFRNILQNTLGTIFSRIYNYILNY